MEQTVPHYVGQYEHRTEHIITSLLRAEPRPGGKQYLAVHGGPRAGVYSRSSESELCDRAYRNVPGAVSKGFADYAQALQFACSGYDATLERRWSNIGRDTNLQRHIHNVNAVFQPTGCF